MARTYFSKKVTVTAGYHIVTGFAEDSFVSIEETGDGVQSVAGADGEVARSVSSDPRCTVKISLLQTSASNAYFMRRYKMDKADVLAMFNDAYEKTLYSYINLNM